MDQKHSIRKTEDSAFKIQSTLACDKKLNIICTVFESNMPVILQVINEFTYFVFKAICSQTINSQFHATTNKICDKICLQIISVKSNYMINCDSPIIITSTYRFYKLL